MKTINTLLATLVLATLSIGPCLGNNKSAGVTLLPDSLLHLLSLVLWDNLLRCRLLPDGLLRGLFDLL